MFKRSFRSQEPSGRVEKNSRLKKSTTASRDAKLAKLQRTFNEAAAPRDTPRSPQEKPDLAFSPSPIVTLTVGRDGRIFAAHQDVLYQAPFFENACRGRRHPVKSGANNTKRIALPDEEPEVFSAILEYLYKGDYYPRLLQGKHRDSWQLEDTVGTPSLPASSPRFPDSASSTPANSPNPNNYRVPPSPTAPHHEATVFISSTGEHILRDTAIYCAAERYGLDELKRLSLRKQGLQSGIDVATILRSAQFAYAHTPDSDSRLRAHYLALIIRCRRTFKRSGTMQAEMEQGGSKLFFDLFVAMCNHLDDVIDVSNSKSPRLV